MDYRPSRVNLDGLSKTETRVCAADVLPGTALKIVAGKFVQAVAADAGVVPLYVANVGHLQGLGPNDAIPAGDSIEGEYLETGRGIAVLVAAGTVVTMDTPLTVGVGGVFAIAQPGIPAVEGNHYVPAVEGTPEIPADGETPAIPAVEGTPAIPAVEGTPAIPGDNVLAYAKEDYTVGDAAELVLVRGA